MCLSNCSGPFIAEEDIVCFKYLRYQSGLTGGHKNYHGKEFVGIVKDISVSGKISVSSGLSFLCTDEDNLNGSNGCNKLGYRYSWFIDHQVSSILVDGVELLIQGLRTPYYNAFIEMGKTYDSIINYDENCDEIEQALHSFKYEATAIDESSSNSVIVRCLIPKGSTYYVGIFDDCDSYASDRLTYVEIIK